MSNLSERVSRLRDRNIDPAALSCIMGDRSTIDSQMRDIETAVKRQHNRFLSNPIVCESTECTLRASDSNQEPANVQNWSSRKRRIGNLLLTQSSDRCLYSHISIPPMPSYIAGSNRGNKTRLSQQRQINGIRTTGGGTGLDIHGKGVEREEIAIFRLVP